MQSQPLRVVQVLGKMMGGGVESTVMNHYRHIDRKRIQFDFLIQSDSTDIPTDEIRELGGKITIIPPYTHIKDYIEATYRFLVGSPYTIIHSHMNSLSVFPLYAAHKAGIPIRIAHSHSTSNPKEHFKNITKNVLRPISRLYPTHYAACSLHAATWLFGKRLTESGQVHIVNNAIDIKHFTFNKDLRTKHRRELDIANGQLVIGQIGRMSSQKNQLFSLDIMAYIATIQPDSVLLFIGDGDLLQNAKHKADSLGIQKNVRFLGLRTDVSEWYSAADVLLFPSLYEGLGMAAIEAQAADLPVVSSLNVPTESIIIPPLVQQLSLKATPETWAHAVINQACQKKKGERIPRNQDLIDAHYGIDESASSLCSWYEELAGKDE